MTRHVIVLLLVLVVSGLTSAQAPVKKAPAAGKAPLDRAAAEQQIIANDRAAIAAFMKGDVAGFKSHIWPDAFGIDAKAGIVRLPDWEKMMKDLKGEAPPDIDHAQVHWVAPDTAILTYHTTVSATVGGQPAAKHWAASVYQKRGEKWLPIFNIYAGPEEAGAGTAK